MPLKSKAQWRQWGALMARGLISKKSFDEARHSTPGGYKALPARVRPRHTKRRVSRR